MTVKKNWFIQIVSMLAQSANLWGGFVPPKYQPWIALGLGAAQGAAGIIQANSNPDGSPASQPYIPPPGK